MILSSNRCKLNNEGPFTHQQLQWLNEKTIPERLFLKSASEFDDKWLYPVQERWEYRFSGNNVVIDFSKGNHFKGLSISQIKLIKIILIYYSSEHSASILYDVSRDLSFIFKEMTLFSHDFFVDYLNKTRLNTEIKSRFFNSLYACRKLDSVGFFSSTDGDDDIEDKLLFVPRPTRDSFNIYSDIDNVLPPSVISMIENGLTEYASRFVPALHSVEEKQKHLDKIKQSLHPDELQDCIILGLCFITGARPVQFSKLAVGDIFIDAESNSITRFALLLPYAKKNKVTVERIAIALPDELGKR